MCTGPKQADISKYHTIFVRNGGFQVCAWFKVVKKLVVDLPFGSVISTTASGAYSGANIRLSFDTHTLCRSYHHSQQ